MISTLISQNKPRFILKCIFLAHNLLVRDSIAIARSFKLHCSQEESVLNPLNTNDFFLNTGNKYVMSDKSNQQVAQPFAWIGPKSILSDHFWLQLKSDIEFHFCCGGHKRRTIVLKTMKIHSAESHFRPVQ